MSSYSIKDLEHLSGVKAHTIRIWEQRYDLLNPDRTDTNIRYYSDHDLKLLLNVALLKDHGFKISKIAGMPMEEISREVAELEDNFGENEHISELTISMIDMDEARFQRVMAQNISKWGFEQTMIKIIYPFLQRIGVLWMTGSIVPAQEHFISSLICRKIIAATEALADYVQTDSDLFLLFLPEGELHELSLLFADYMIRSRGKRTIYLGQSVPMEDVSAVCNSHNPKYAFSILNSTAWIDNGDNSLERLAAYMPQTTLLLSGYQANHKQYDIPNNVLIIKDFDALIKLLS